MKNVLIFFIAISLLFFGSCNSGPNMPSIKEAKEILDQAEINGKFPADLEGRKLVGLSALVLCKDLARIHRENGGTHSCYNKIFEAADELAILMHSTKDAQEAFSMLVGIAEFADITEKHLEESDENERESKDL